MAVLMNSAICDISEAVAAERRVHIDTEHTVHISLMFFQFNFPISTRLKRFMHIQVSYTWWGAIWKWGEEKNARKT